MKFVKPALRPMAAAWLFAGAGAIALSGCEGPAGEDEPAAEARSVTVVQVAPVTMEGGLSASGVLVSREEAAVGSDLSGYRVARVYVEQGAWVRQGQPLVQLDDSLLRAQIAQQAALTLQRQNEAQRVDGLDDQGVLSNEQIESRRLQARAQEAALQDLQTRQSHMTIKAPVSGLVLERNVRPGEIASAGGASPMFVLARGGLVELAAEVAEDNLAAIKIGDGATVTLPSGETVDGRVRLIEPTVDQQTKLGRVRIAMAVRPDLRPGGFAKATFTGVTTAALAVPETAVLYNADGASVVVVEEDNHVRNVPVRTGRRADGYVELLEGPPQGAWVLQRGAAFVLPGDLVDPVRAQD